MSSFKTRTSFLTRDARSDLPEIGSPFSLVNSKGKVIPGDQLGLVLYKKGGTVCLETSNFITVGSTPANAICREMNYSFASRWMDTDDSSIKWNFTGLGYYPELEDVACVTPDWINCTYEIFYRALGFCEINSNYLMLSCTGRFIWCTKIRRITHLINDWYK